MSKSNAFENSLLLLVFNNTNIADIGDATGLRGSTAAGVLNVALHIGAVAEGDAQSVNEANYTGYARVGVARSSAGWTVTGNAVANAALVAFPQCTAGSNTVTHFSVGVATSGTTVVLYKGTLDASRAISAGITPEFAAGDLDISED